MKNFFFAIILQSIALFAQTNNANNISKKNKLPIIYLNQYFQYDAANIESIELSSLEIFYKSLQLTHNSRLATLSEVLNKKVQGELELFDINKKSLFKIKTKDLSLKQTFEMSVDEFNESHFFCIKAINVISQIKICKTLKNEKSDFSQKTVTIDNVNVESETGVAVLTQQKKNLILKIEFLSDNYIELTTRKRVFAVVEAEKDVENKKYKMSFSDRELPETDWNDEIAFEQEYFEIPNDDLIVTMQDFVVSDKTKNELKVKFNVPIISKRKQTNYYLITPMFGYHRFSGNSNEKKASLFTNLGVGAKLVLARQMVTRNKYLSWFDYWGLSTGFKQIKFSPALSTQTIGNSNTLLYNFDASLNRYFNFDFSYGFKFNVQKDIVYAKESEYTLSIGSIYNIDIGTHLEYVLFDYKKYKSTLQVGVAGLLPKTINDNSSGWGVRYYSKIDCNYILGRHVYSLGLNYSLRRQSTKSKSYVSESLLIGDGQEFEEEIFDLTAGYTYNF